MTHFFSVSYSGSCGMRPETINVRVMLSREKRRNDTWYTLLVVSSWKDKKRDEEWAIKQDKISECQKREAEPQKKTTDKAKAAQQRRAVIFIFFSYICPDKLLAAVTGLKLILNKSCRCRSTLREALDCVYQKLKLLHTPELREWYNENNSRFF